MCDHTMHLTDTAGKRIGSWIDEPYRGRVRVVCRHCRKFYGYRREEMKNGQGSSGPGRHVSLLQQQQEQLSAPGRLQNRMLSSVTGTPSRGVI